MTVPTGEYATDDYEEIDEDTAYNPVLVELAGTVQRQNAPDFGGCALFTAPLAGTGIPVQILQRRPTREQAYVRNNDPANSIIIAERLDKLQQATPIGFIIPPGSVQKIESQQPYYAVAANVAGASPASLVASGYVIGPAALQTIASVTLPPGTYTVSSQVGLVGTTGSQDGENFGLYLNGVQLFNYQNPATSGIASYVTISPLTLVIPAGASQVLTIEAIAAGTATAGYRAFMSATPSGASGLAPAAVSVSVLDEAWLVLDTAHPERGYKHGD